jgi:hypothetical protein
MTQMKMAECVEGEMTMLTMMRCAVGEAPKLSLSEDASPVTMVWVEAITMVLWM